MHPVNRVKVRRNDITNLWLSLILFEILDIDGGLSLFLGLAKACNPHCCEYINVIHSASVVVCMSWRTELVEL